MHFENSVQVVAFIASFAIALITGPLIIPMLRKLKFGQTVRDDGPQSHLIKTGTPIMGGVIFMIPLIILTIFFSLRYPQILPLTLVTIGFGAIGFMDDYIKVVKKRKDGLYANQKMLGLIIIATLFAFYLVQFTGIGTSITIPFMNQTTLLDLKWLFIPFTVFVLIAVTNAVNLTDGVDGLAGGVTLIVMVFFTLVAMTRGEWDYVMIFSALIAGGCLGFLAFNTHPAKVFMGDTGSLALGGAVAASAIVMKMPLIILIVGAIYVIEAISVILQVGSFKLRGKRIFKMAPIHHHFELCGWKETKIVTVFYGVTVLLCILGFIALRFKFTL